MSDLEKRISSWSYLRCNAEHFERRRHVEALGDADVTEIDAVSLAPDTQPFDVENRQITWKSQHQRFRVVAAQRVDFAVFVRHLSSLLARLGAGTHPEKGI